MRAPVVLLTLLLLSSLSASAAITSTTVGGNWNSPGTWIGGTIPGVGDDVVLQGSVALTTDAACKSLTIQSAGGVYNNATLTVVGDVVNGGTIRIATLRVGGALRHNGVEFSVTNVLFTSTGIQPLSMTAGRQLNASFTIENLGTVKMESNIRIDAYWGNYLAGGTLDLNGYEMAFGQIFGGRVGGAPSQPGTIRGSGTLRGEPSFRGSGNLNTPTYPDPASLRLTGDSIRLAGQINGFTATADANLIVIDTLRLGFLITNGTFDNRGLVSWNINTAYLRAFGDVKHNGSEFTVSWVYFSSRGTQTLSAAPGRRFNMSFAIDSLGTLKLGSDVAIDSYFGGFLGGGTLQLDNHQFTFGQLHAHTPAGLTPQPATIRGSGTLRGEPSFRGSGNLNTPTYPDPATLRLTGDSIRLTGQINGFTATSDANLIVVDTLRLGFLLAKGTFDNRGLVSWNINTAYLRAFGDVKHNGSEFTVSWIYLSSRGTQTLSVAPGRYFNASFVIDSLGTMQLGSPVAIDSYYGIFLGGGTLDLNGRELVYGQLYGKHSERPVSQTATILGPGTIRGQSAYRGGGTLNGAHPKEDLQLIGDTITLRGANASSSFISRAPLLLPDTLWAYDILLNAYLRSTGVIHGSAISRLASTADFVHTGPDQFRLHLEGSRRRTVIIDSRGSEVHSVGHRVTLTGDNLLPTLVVADSSTLLVEDDATLTILPGGTLQANSVDRVENKGTITISSFDDGNTFWKLRATERTSIDTFRVTTIGAAVAALPDGIATRWLLEPLGAAGDTTLESMTFRYRTDEVDLVVDENTLHPFYSPDNGASWEPVTGGTVTRDVATNTLTVASTFPASGLYTLAPNDAVAGVVPDTVRFEAVESSEERHRIVRIWNPGPGPLLVKNVRLETPSTLFRVGTVDCLNKEVAAGEKCYFILYYKPDTTVIANRHDEARVVVETADATTPTHTIVAMAEWNPRPVAQAVVTHFPERISVRPPDRMNAADYYEVSIINLTSVPAIHVLEINLPEYVYMQIGSEVKTGRVRLFFQSQPNTTATRRIPVRISVRPEDVAKIKGIESDKENDATLLAGIPISSTQVTGIAGRAGGAMGHYAKDAALGAMGEAACGSVVRLLQSTADDLNLSYDEVVQSFSGEIGEAVKSTIPDLSPTSADNVVSKATVHQAGIPVARELTTALGETVRKQLFNQALADGKSVLGAATFAKHGAESVVGKIGGGLGAVGIGCWSRIVEISVEEIVKVYEFEQKEKYKEHAKHMDDLLVIKQKGKSMEYLESLFKAKKIDAGEYGRIFDRIQNTSDPAAMKGLLGELMQRAEDLTDDHQSQVRAPWDPNDKLAYAGRTCLAFKTDERGVETCAMDVVEYSRQQERYAFRIVFENKKEATADAERVVVIDTLDPAFDPATVTILGSSHPHLIKLERDGQTVRFVFDDIYLPPNINAPEGEGWLEFHARPRQSPLPIGTTLTNVADIYFDYNRPVRTGRVTTIIGPDAPWPALPADEGEDVARNARFLWTDVLFADRYGLQIASDSTFASLVVDTVLSDRRFVPFLAAKTRYHWRTRAYSDTIHSPWSEISSFTTTDQVLRVDDASAGDRSALLVRAFPNPSRGVMHIEYAIERAGAASVSLYDIEGRFVREVVPSRWQTSGQHRVELDASDLPSGVYTLRLCCGVDDCRGRTVVIER